jgi:signal transduction histidine kinase
MLKLIELNSIRSRMVTGFLFLTFLILILALVSLSIIDRTTRIAQLHSNISQLEIQTLILIKSDNDFFDLETINDEYFTTHKSNFLKKHDSLHHLITLEIKNLTTQETNQDNGLRKNLKIIDSTLARYHRQFKTLEQLVFQKGFKDYGLEGKMRHHAHVLEKIVAKTDIISILFLRRHEKDFLLRNDTMYLHVFRNRSNALCAKLKAGASQNDSALYHLSRYQQLFYEIVSVQRELGLTSRNGLRSELNSLTNLLATQYYSLSEYSYRYAETAHHKLRIIYIALLGGAILFSLLSGYWISKRLSEPIAQLSKAVRGAIQSRDTAGTDFRIRKGAIEITTLANSFLLLIDQLNKQLNKSKVKSVLLKDKNRELKKINRELDNFLYSTAHDLRSPLSSLLGLINIMRYENRQPELIMYINMMEKSLQRSENFIAQIVSFSKNKRLSLVPEKLDLNSIIENILDDHQFIEGASRIAKTITIIDHVPFYSDRNRVMILLSNLISNAIKYADLEKDHPFIQIDITIDNDQAVMQFTDNGVGIEEQHLSSIFDMFYRAHATSKGSGLGLFIFKETINRMNGQVQVESLPQIGTKFKIYLPNMSQLSVQRLSRSETSQSMVN